MVNLYILYSKICLERSKGDKNIIENYVLREVN